MKNATDTPRVFSFSPLYPLLALLLLLLPGLPALGAPPDATDPGTHIDVTYTYNLGPTGARGWIYSTGNEWLFVPEGLTIESRQILITSVDAGSPAYGVLTNDDVIVGIGSTPFTSDARKAFALAIGEAEKAANAGQLKLKVWRSGVTTDNVTITLPVMGSYSDTAPYNCPKSALILTNACNYLAARAINSGYTEGNAVIALALLAAGRPQDLAKVQAYARSVAAGVGTLTVPLNEMCAWPWGYNNTFLSEYYLATGDTNVLHAISEYTITSAKGQSWCGTYGHGMAWPKPDYSSTHGIVPPYGALNQAGQLVNIGIILGDKCGITNTEIAPAIERGRKYFGYFAGKGAIPYGESPPEELHDDNGKNGEAALLLALQGQADMSTQVQYFVKSCVASYALREFGHCGPYWAHLWPPLAANLGGTNAMAAYFKQIQWELDLARRWDGSFVSHGPLGGNSDLGAGSATGEFLLTYATALKKIYLTGKNASSSYWLSTNDVNESIADGVCTLRPDMKNWTTNQLVAALSSWSAQKRAYAAEELVTRAGVSTLMPVLMTMAEGTNVYLRMGATKVLTMIQDTTSLPVLARRLNDSDYYVRWLAVGGYSDSARFLFKATARPILTNMLSTIISNEAPLEPVNWNEPCQVAQSYLGSAVFNGQLANSISGVFTNLLYPAIGAMSRGAGRGCLIGFFNGGALQTSDVNALAPLLTRTLMDGFTIPDLGVPTSIVNLLSRYYYDDGIAAAMLFPRVVLNRARLDANTCLAALERYRSAATSTLPELYYWNANPPPPPVEGPIPAGGLSPTIAVIEGDRSAPPALQYFNKITSASVTPMLFTNPVATASLRASGYSITGDPVTYIWSKVRGAGPVTFSPNCTAASSNSTATFTIPGSYVLKLTVADAYIGDGTNGYGGMSTNFTVAFKDIVSQTNYPPTANSQSVVLDQDTVKAITLTGTDPEGYALYYSLVSGPANGTLSGMPPNLIYKPATLFSGTDSFTFTVMDSEGQVSGPATVSITVIGHNHPPAALHRSLPVTNNMPTAILLDGSDVDGDALTYTVLTQPAHGLLTGTAPNLTYTPATNYNAVDSFTFKVNDGTVDSANIATVTLNMGTIYTGIYSEFFQQPPTVNGWPDMANLLPNDTRIDTKMSITHDYFPTNYEDHFSSRHIAYMNVPAYGNYTFTIGADDNTRVYVDEAWVIQQFFPNSGSCTLQLTPGYHGIRVEFTESYGDNSFNLYWSGPGASGLIPASAFVRCVGNPGPPAPTGLKTTPGNGLIALDWVDSARVSSYSVKRSLATGGPYVTIATNVTAGSYTDSAVTNGTTYYYVVSATGTGGEGLDSNEAYGAPVSTVTINVAFGGTGTSRPMNGTVFGGPAAYAGSTWNDFTSTGGGLSNLRDSVSNSTAVSFTLSQYKASPGDWGGTGILRLLGAGVHSDPGHGGGWQPDPGTFPTLLISGLSTSHNYDLYLASRSSGGTVNSFNVGGTIDATTTIVGGTTLWANNSAAFGTAWAEGINYVRFAALSPGANGQIKVMEDTASSRYTLNGFQLVDVGIQPPAIPAGLTASGANGRALLNWSATARAAGYVVKRSLRFDGTYTGVGTSAGTNYTDTTVVIGTTYYYLVSATNAVGEGGNSGWVGVMPVPPIPPAPANLSATPSDSAVSLGWSPSTGATNYNVYRSMSSGAPYALVGGALSSIFADHAVTNGLTYYYVVTAANLGGESGSSGVASATPMPPLPGAPTGLLVTGTNGQVGLSWTAVTNATGYNVKRSLVSGGPYSVIGRASGTTYADTAIIIGTNYYYVVSATNVAGESANSTQVSANAVASSAKDILSFSFGALGSATITATNIAISVPYGTAVTNLAPTYTVSAFATCAPASGANLSFTTPQTYTVTAQDSSTKSYSVTVTVLPYAPTLINVALGNRSAYSMAGIYSSDYSQSATPGRAAPRSYAGNTWNQASSLANLLDSKGGATTVGFSISQYKDGPGDWGGPGKLQLFGAGMHSDAGHGGGWQPDPGTFPTLLISGLTPNHLYDLYLVTRDGGGCKNTFTVGGTIDATVPANPLIVGGTTLLADNSAGNGATWVENQNYVHFTALVPDSSGNITVLENTLGGRYCLNGFQLLDVTRAAPVARLTNSPASSILATTAVLHATLEIPVGTCAVIACWNTVNGETNAALWANSAYVGSWTNVASTNLSFTATGLTPSRPYYFTFRATNALETFWAANVLSFTTLTPPPPVPVLPVGGVKVTNGVPSFSFSAAAGCKYRLDYKNALRDTNWTLGAWTTNATGSSLPMTLIDSTASGQPQRFYRLEAANP